MIESPAELDWVALSTEALPVADATSWATTPDCGAVVAFSGVVRNHSEGRDEVSGLTYEAYEEAARSRLAEVAAATRQRWPAIVRLALLHRIGHIELSETSVVVVVSAPHRAEAFDAGRYAIDTLKASVPIWKREHWGPGASRHSEWAATAVPVRPVHDAPVA